MNMDIIEFIDDDFNQHFNGSLELGYSHREAIKQAREGVIELYGLKEPYDHKTLEHIEAVSLAY
ncbi:MAG: hypothetical protein WBP82_06915 [Leuconostoc mesenteroides]